jgi:hypothetical protein
MIQLTNDYDSQVFNGDIGRVKVSAHLYLCARATRRGRVLLRLP